MGDQEDDGLWEKPSWAKKGGVKLKKTGQSERMKKDGNLAAPITFTPFKKEDHSNHVANKNVLRRTKTGEAAAKGENLAAPITFTPFKNTDHTNKIANKSRLGPSTHEKGRTKKKSDNPVENFDAPLPPAFKQVRIQRLAFQKQQSRRKNNDTFVSLNSSHMPSQHSYHPNDPCVKSEHLMMSQIMDSGDESSEFDEDEDSFASFDDSDSDSGM